MINLLGKIPNKNLGIAVSGGADSMAVLNFILNSHRKPTIFFFNHGTDHSKKAEEFVTKFCEEKDLELIKGKITRSRQDNESPEEYWRILRYEFFHSYPEYKIITAHHLDDCLETWIMSWCHNFDKPKFIPFENKNVIRPFLLTKRESLIEWNLKNNVEWIEDESNQDVKYSRNRTRHNIIPEMLKLNPGMHKHLARIIEEHYWMI